MFTDAAHYLQVYDPELILSWTPREYQAFIRGSQHRQIDQYEYMAKQAMAYRYAVNSKRASEKKIFNAKQARRNLDRGYKDTDKNIERYIDLNDKFKGFKPDFKPKGG